METISVKDLFQQVKRPASKYDTYFDVYETLFSKYKNKDVVFVEIGILGGGSLEVWKKYFGPGSKIIGIDLNPELQNILLSDGFQVYIGDQANSSFWDDFFLKVGKVDIILDDGGHTNQQQIITLECAFKNVNEGGMVVIEDVHASYMPEFGNPGKGSFVEYSKKIIDIINSRSTRVSEKLIKDSVGFAANVYSIQYFESIIAYHIDSRLCKKSIIKYFGDKDSLPNKEIPADLRYINEAKNFTSFGPIKGLAGRIVSMFRKMGS